MAHDITERKVAEQALRDSEERIRTLLAELPAALILVDKSGTIEMANETTTRMTGYTSDDLVDNFIGILFPDELADPERLPKLIEDCSKASFDTSTTKNTGERVPVQVSVNEFKLAGKEKYLFILVDFTERYAIEQLRREFVAMIGHELRTPLSSIEGILVLASDGVFGALNEQGARMMGKGQNETRRLLGLVNDLLELEKMRSGTFPINREQMSLDEVIASSIQVVMPIADKNKLSINYLPQPLSLNADPARILQVLVNLLSNAIKFSPKGGTINVTVETLSSGVKICVRDYGRGIPPEKISQLFQRYSQVQADDCRKLGGTGLGLAICKAIVDQHQGTIGVESVPGEGSTFWFCLES